MVEDYQPAGEVGRHALINHVGVVIHVTARTLTALKRSHYVARNRATGLYGFKPELHGIYLDLEGGRRRSGSERRLHPEIYAELGPDLSGPASVNCRCPACCTALGWTENTPMPGKEHAGFRAEHAISEMRRERGRPR